MKKFIRNIHGSLDRKTIIVGIKVAISFVVTILVMFSVSYYVLSESFYRLLMNNTITLLETSVSQGVKLIENEIEGNKEKIRFLSRSLSEGEINKERLVTLKESLGNKEIRVRYISENQQIASDDDTLDVSTREDIVNAYQSETAVYGPYFNENNEYVLCYATPIVRNDAVMGILCVEEDGYELSNLIKSIRFQETGESYILNEEGTDIAVSNFEHMDWVETQFNAKELYKENPSDEITSIKNLEEKCFEVERGTGTYYRDGDLCYVVYESIPSLDWVLLAGMKESEIISLSQAVFFTSISNGPILPICITIFIILVCLIAYWLISSLRKNAQINRNLEIIASKDALTGLHNRRYLETNIVDMWEKQRKANKKSALIMMDIDDFKLYNDRYGHKQGDECLQKVALIIQEHFNEKQCYTLRYGGEEFVCILFNVSEEEAYQKGCDVCKAVEAAQIENGDKVISVSVGIYYEGVVKEENGIYECIDKADEAMYEAKTNGKNRVILKK